MPAAALELAERLRRRQVSSVELVRAWLDEIRPRGAHIVVNTIDSPIPRYL